MAKCTRAMRLVASAALVGSLVATVSAPAALGAIASRISIPSVAAVPVTASGAASVNGTVTNTAGQPIDGLEILLAGTDGSTSAGFSDAQGTFSVSAAAGDYVPYFIDSSGSYVYGCYEGTTAPGQFAALTGPVNCAMITLSSGETFRIDATIPHARHITGTVAGSDGTRLGRVLIDATDANGNAQAETRAGTDGNFSMTVPVGSYQIRVYDTTVGTTAYAGGCYNHADTGNLSIDNLACQSLDVTKSDATGVNPIQPTETLNGFTISGTVTGLNGSALPYIQVDAWDGTAGWGNPGLTFTDANGSYALTVPQGNYQVSVTDWGQTHAGGCYSQTAAGNVSTDYSACLPVSVASDVTGISMSLPIGGQTPTGADVSVTPSDSSGSFVNASVSFGQVDSPGTTTLQTSTSGPQSSGFSVGLSPTYYDITTVNVAYTGPVTVCLPFDVAAYSDASSLRLYHFDNGAWKDVTTSISYLPPTICGVTASLSPFVVGQAPAQQSQSITFGPLAARVYGATSITLAATASSGLMVSYTTTGPCTVSGGGLTITGVGTCTVDASQFGNASWAAATPVSQPFRIAPAALTITAPSVSRSYGAANPAFTPTYSGLVDGDTASSLTTAPACTTTATSTSSVGTYPINCSGAVDPNYSFSYVAGTLRIAIADRFVTSTNTALNVAAPGFLALTQAPGATVVISTKPAGKLTLGSNGSFIYVPKTGFRGTDSFAYRLSLGGTLSAPVTVTIYVVGMGVNCAKCNLSGLGLSGANLLGANLASANMAGARLDHAILVLSNLSGADLSYATLDHAMLTLANLSRATLTSANLTAANLILANLSGSTLTSADLTGANLTGANLAGANMASATLTGATVSGAGWSKTVCPDGSNANKDGGTCVGHFKH